MNYLVTDKLDSVNVELIDCALVYSDVYSEFELAKRVALDLLSEKITALQAQYQDMLNFTEERCRENYEFDKFVEYNKQIKRLG